MDGGRLVALRRIGAEWVVAVDVMAMAMNPNVWSGKKGNGARTCKTPLRGPLWGLGDGPVAAFDEACAGYGGGGEGEGEVGGFWFGEAGDGR